MRDTDTYSCERLVLPQNGAILMAKAKAFSILV